MSKEIWVRSADSNELMLCGDFEVVDEYFYARHANKDNFIVQEYATHERALEVLDEIQRFLTPKWHIPQRHKVWNIDMAITLCREWEIDNITELNNNGVFQLPKE